MKASDSIQGVMTADEVQFAAQRQYFSRPADQKFAELDDLFASVKRRRENAIEFEASIVDMSAHQRPEGGIIFQADMKTPKGGKIPQFMNPTHWAFGQTAALIQAPARYLRTLAKQEREDLVVKLINHGIGKREAAGFKLLASDVSGTGDDLTLYATTSPTYGRIWDADVVDMAKRAIDAQNGKFFSPWAWGKKHRALFAGPQDIFLYFIDGGSIVDGGGERDELYRGVMIWNSEVGAATFGIATFLFRKTCGNFMIYGIENVKVLNIRHTSGGPERFIAEAIPALKEFAESSVAELEGAVKAAKAYNLPTDEDEIVKFAMKNGFNAAEAKRAIQFAKTEEGQIATLWDLVNGFTASARMMAFADAKADLERRAGKLMKIVEDKAPVKVLVGAH